MAAALTTTVSTKGQVVLPSAVRHQHRWNAGTVLIVEEVPGGVLLRTAPERQYTRIEDVYGSANYTGPALTLEEMDAAITAEADHRARR